MAAQNANDELSELRIVSPDDEKIIAAAKWTPRLELACEGKRCLLLGGHQIATNTIMVWCTCGAADCDHPDGSRLMALDSWVIEHCRGEDLAKYEDADEDEEGGGGSEDGDKLDKLDAMVMEAAVVVRVERNVLPKQVSLRQLLCNVLVSQGGNSLLKGVHFWVYWYDQAIPRPQDREYRGIGTSWVPGPLARKDLGVWYKARIIKCDATAGTITVTYDVDNSQDEMYLLVAFTHFGVEPPSRGGRPVVLPDMERVATLGMPGASKSGKAKLKTAKRPRDELGDFVVPLDSERPPAKKPAAAAAKASGGEAVTKKKTKAAPAAAEGSAAGGSGSGAAVKSGGGASVGTKPVPAAAKPAAVAPKKAGANAAAAKPANAAGKPAVAAKAAKRSAPVPVEPEEENEDDDDEDEEPDVATAPAPKPAPVQARPPAKAPAPAAAAAAPAATAAPKPSPPPLPQKPPQQKQPSASPAAPNAPAAATSSDPRSRPAASTLAPAPASAPPCHEFEPLPLALTSPNVPSPPMHLPPSADQRKALKSAAKLRLGFCRLLSGKAEQFPVFAFNEVDAEQPPNFDYLLHDEEAVAAELAAAQQMQPGVAAALKDLQDMASASQPRYDEACGRSYHSAVRHREEQEDAAAGKARRPPLSEPANYDASGRLLVTRPLGLHECSPACRDALCRANMTLSLGLRRTLEVFRTPDRSWGVRCQEPLSPGDFVAPLVGRLVPAAQLLLQEQGPGSPAALGAGCTLAAPGVVLLNHFFELWEAVYSRGLTWCDQHVRTWQLPPNPLAAALADGSAYADIPRPPADSSIGNGSSNGAGGGCSSNGTTNPAPPASALRRPLGAMLALDTRRAGNVARFVRHCYGRPGEGVAAARGAAGAAAGGGGGGGNGGGDGDWGAGVGGSGPALVIQPVLCGAHCRSPLLYCVGLYVARHVRAGEELTCDWRAVSLAPLPGPAGRVGAVGRG